MQSPTPFARIGTRGSPLALTQARLVRGLLATAHGVSEDDIAIEVISTGGDRSQAGNASLVEIGGKGLFTKEIDEAMLAGRVDIGVHSSKDVATRLPDGIILAAFLEREDVRDAFMSVKVQSIDHLAERAKFGTSSIRRAAQVLRTRPDLEIVPFRGNVGTRLQKLLDGVADATMLAMAGLNRLGEGHRATALLDPQIFMPAPAQGAIGIAVRSDDARMAGLVAALDHAPTHTAITAERAMLAVLDGSCRTPVGALTRIDAGVLTLRAILSLDGRTAFDSAASGNDPVALGRQVGEDLIAQAGTEWLAQWASNMTRMLVTRPEPDAQSTLARLAALDIEAVAVPLMVRQTLGASLPPPDGFAAMVLTSANAVRSLVDRGVLEHYTQLPVLAVGDRTAREAVEAGFAQVSSAAGGLGDLVNAIAISGLKGRCFHPTARHQSGDLAKALAPHGVMVATAKVYDMVAIDALPAAVLDALADGGIGAVLAYSRRTAEIFATLACSLEPQQRRRPAMLCLSEAVAEPLLEAHFNRISLADRPDEDAMMALALAVAREQTGP